MVPLRFTEIWSLDFEFNQPNGERHRPVCMVALELRTGREIRLWRNELHQLREAPFDTGDTALVVAYFASAEMNCFKALGWKPPRNVVCLFAEHRVATNGISLPRGNGILGAMALRGLPALEAATKEAMRALIINQDNWTDAEQAAILDYCAIDTVMAGKLLAVMARTIDWDRALLRGRYMTAVAAMEHTGVPLDQQLLGTLNASWDSLKRRLIDDVDPRGRIYESYSFREHKFEAWLARHGIPWPRLPSGALMLDRDTFKDQARTYPAINLLHELRSTVSKLRLTGLEVGQDGRNRVMLSPFGSVTGRNQPSNASFIFGPATWLRGLIKPPEGHGLAYLDFSAQEIAIAAALSGDQEMIDGYLSGDPHLDFAKAAGLAPPDATKRSHGPVRDRCKVITLGVLYGMQPFGLAQRLGVPLAEAEALLAVHKRRHRRFWSWSEQVTESAILKRSMFTRFGWWRRLDGTTNPRSLMNWQMQGNGSEMLRVACIGLTEAGIEVCAPVHDAVLIAAPLAQLDHAIAQASEIMVKASVAVTGGLPCRVGAEVIRWPDRYADARGAGMWRRVHGILAARLGSPDASLRTPA